METKLSYKQKYILLITMFIITFTESYIIKFIEKTFEFKMPIYFDLIFFSIMALFFFVFLIFLLLIRFNLFISKKLMISGKFDQAIVNLKKCKGKYRILKSITNNIHHNLAFCYHYMGDFDKSNNELDNIELDKVDENMKFAVLLSYSNNFLELNTNKDQALEYINQCSKIMDIPEIKINLAYLDLIQNNINSSKKKLEEYFTQSKQATKIKIGLITTLIFPKKISDLQINYRIGKILWANNEIEEAKKYLTLVKDSKYKSYYGIKSKEILESSNSF